MQSVKLDRIDRRILRDLQDNGRMTNVELASRVGISAPPCLRRVRALEQADFIRGYHADVEPTMLGYEAELFALVGLESQALDRLQGFEATVDGWNEVRECHMVRGGGDFLLKIYAHNTAHENRLTQALTSAPDVTRVTTFPVIRTEKAMPGVPIETSPVVESAG